MTSFDSKVLLGFKKMRTHVTMVFAWSESTDIFLYCVVSYEQRWSRGHKARDQGQGQPFRGQTLSRPRTGMLEAKAKNQGHKRKCSPKKKKVFTKIFQAYKKLFERSTKF